MVLRGFGPPKVDEKVDFEGSKRPPNCHWATAAAFLHAEGLEVKLKKLWVNHPPNRVLYPILGGFLTLFGLRNGGSLGPQEVPLPRTAP